jgi:nickel/cobalt exporter
MQGKCEDRLATLSEFVQSGAANAWVFAPSAILLGALHGLEPGHSKTMMAAFIVAIRGTLSQAVLLGLAATVSHTAIVWVVALGGLYVGSQWKTETAEPYLEIVSGLLILAVAAWMAWRSWSERRRSGAFGGGRHHHRVHDHHHDHRGGFDHHHAVHAHHHPHHHHDAHAPRRAPAHAATVEEFDKELMLIDPSVVADAHERAHAEDINRRFANRQVTTGQIILFGLTGGLIPCPASITVLLLCLQLGRLALGAALVLCFSIGLALTMVLVGAAAALGVRHVSSRWPRLNAIASRAPFVSSAIVSLVGLYTLYIGVAALS